MASVDLALMHFADEAGLDLTMWRLWDDDEVGAGHRGHGAAFEDAFTGLSYHLLRGNLAEAMDADCLLYWGDFHHMAAYHRMVDHHLRAIGVDPGENHELARRHLLLDGVGVPEGTRVLSFGSTLLLNTAADYRSDYGTALTGFLAKAEGTWFRDPYSSYVSSLYDSADHVGRAHQGVDAALLLPAPSRDRDASGLGVFFGRSAARAEHLGRFTESLARSLGEVPRWINWGAAPAFWPIDRSRRFRVTCPSLELDSSDLRARSRQLIALLKDSAGHALPAPTNGLDSVNSLMDYAFVVTDTYHLALNAWRCGTPAICVVDRPIDESHRVNAGDPQGFKDKRTLLFMTLDATDFLVDAFRFSSYANVRRSAEAAARSLADQNLVESVLGRRDHLVSHATSLLRAAFAPDQVADIARVGA